MSRSYKKPYVKYGGPSDKKSKRIANKKFRRINKLKLIQDPSGVFKLMREISSTWDFASDGLAHYVGDGNKRWTRK
jgi:hypothetical protein